MERLHRNSYKISSWQKCSRATFNACRWWSPKVTQFARGYFRRILSIICFISFSSISSLRSNRRLHWNKVDHLGLVFHFRFGLFDVLKRGSSGGSIGGYTATRLCSSVTPSLFSILSSCHSRSSGAYADTMARMHSWNWKELLKEMNWVQRIIFMIYHQAPKGNQMPPRYSRSDSFSNSDEPQNTLARTSFRWTCETVFNLEEINSLFASIAPP